MKGSNKAFINHVTKCPIQHNCKKWTISSIENFPTNSEHIIILPIQDNEKQDDLKTLNNPFGITDLEMDDNKPIY